MSEDIYDELAEAQGLTVIRGTGSGIVPSMARLDGPSFSPPQLDPRIRDFYERTSQYELDLTGETQPLSRPFLWVLVNTVGKSLNQLSLPIRGGGEAGRGHKVISEIVELVDRAGRVQLTGWSRKDAQAKDASYIAFYDVVTPPGHDSPCIKTMFPVPRGSVTVLLRPKLANGRFYLESDGKNYGEAGWYLILQRADGTLKVAQLGWFGASFEVQADEDGHLWCHQVVRVFGCSILKFRYRMVRKSGVV